MRYLSAGLIYVAISAVVSLAVGMISHGLNLHIAVLSLLVGAVSAVAAFFATPRTVSSDIGGSASRREYRSIWLWLLAVVFALFAVRSFCWLLYFNADEMLIQSPNNLGDLGLHLTYIKTFANGLRLWPDSPIYVYSKLRYPAGMDLFNALLTIVGIDLRHQLAVTGLIASAATFYAFYRWSGTFGIAGFLFNGGTAGFAFLWTHGFIDYQGGPTISWKNLPLSMFVTQRGLLYAIPAGLVLLWNWRVKYGSEAEVRGLRLPLWVEYVLYASLPLFHVHTFLAVSIVLVAIFVSRPQSRRSILALIGASIVPATFFVWLISDNFNAKSIMGWNPGWTQHAGEFAMPFFKFWFVNFGVLGPLVLFLLLMISRQEWRRAESNARDFSRQTRGFPSALRRLLAFELPIDVALLCAAIAIFLIAVLIKTAPWEWDNIKVLIWAYFIVLPILWTRLIRPWPLATRAVVCLLLFFSGFVTLIGGLAAGRPGFGFANRAETDFLAAALRPLPVEARFAAFPTYNHPLLLNGRKLVMGYDGHLWTQGIDYGAVAAKLRLLMLGQGDWMQTARQLEVRYMFWGREEAKNYPTSSRPWETTQPIIAKGNWGTIYDLHPTRG